jgi:hypothetical protein
MLVMNLENLLQLLFVLLAFWLEIMASLNKALRRRNLHQSMYAVAA